MKRIIIFILITALLSSYFVSAVAYASENLSQIDISWEEYFKDIKTNLDEYKNVHPRIWLNNSDFIRIKGYAINEYKDLWSLVEASAERCVLNSPKEFIEDEENVWMNTQGKELVNLIFAYKISQKDTYLNSILSYIDKICSYPSWSNSATEDNCHLAGNSNFLALGIAYDWLYNELGTKRKQKIIDNITRRIEDYNYDTSYGFDSINLHNSIVINTSAFVALAAMYEEVPKAEEYMKKIAAKITTLTMEVMPDDGAAFEAVNYSSYTWTGILQAGMIMKDLLNVDILNHPVFNEYAKFSVYSYLPVDGWYTEGDDIFGWGDGTEDSNGNLLSVMSYMAKKNQNKVYKYFIDKRIEYAISKNLVGYQYMYPLIFADPALNAENPYGNPDFPEFFTTEDTGYVFMKNGWSGKEDSIHFHAGPILGKTAQAFREIYTGNTLGSGHNHPDIGSPLIFAEGEWLFDDDNYVTGVTENHNTLMINGIGQVADSKLRNQETDYGFTSWQAMIYSSPKIIKKEQKDGIMYVACDLTDIYPDEHYKKSNVGLNKYIRHFIYLENEKTLLVTDDILTKNNSDLELRWHPTSQTVETASDGSYLYTGKYSKMRLEAFNTGGTIIENNIIKKVAGKNGETKDSLVVQIKKRGTKWLQSTAISWQNNTLGNPLNLSYTENDSECIFNYEGGTISLDTHNLTVDKEETVYYFNDFTKAEDLNKLQGVGTFDGELDEISGVFKLKKGTYKLNTDINSIGKNAYIDIPYEGDNKPDLCVEYKITPYDLSGKYVNNSKYRNIYTNNHGIDAVFIGGNVIEADSTMENNSDDDYPIYQGSINNKSIMVKILYSAAENIRTVYINGECMGTYQNKATEKSWCDSEDKKFHFVLVKNKTGTDMNPLEIDYIKVTKLESEMVKIPLTVSGRISLPSYMYSNLWIPNNAQVKFNVYPNEGVTGIVTLNGKNYIDGFVSDFSCITPELTNGTMISVCEKNSGADFEAYTVPYNFQYERWNGKKSVIVAGRATNAQGYEISSCGILFSLTNKDLLLGEDIYCVVIDENKKDSNGNFVIELQGNNLNVGQEIYYRAYVNYTNILDKTEVVNQFGNVETAVIR